MAAVFLKPLLPLHLALLERWLTQSHVARWYPRPEADLEWATRPPPGASQAIIAWGAQEVGYLRWQRVARELLDSLGLYEIPAGSVDADLLIGEEGLLGRGLGPAALELLAVDLGQDGDVPLIGLTTSIENTRAHRAFEKAGFRIERQYDPDGLGLCHLMIRDLRSGGGGLDTAALEPPSAR
jgi:aminoglycoside 6'-N-acetyltransferase